MTDGRSSQAARDIVSARTKAAWADPEKREARIEAIRIAVRKSPRTLAAADRAELERRALAGENCFDLAIDYLISVGHVRRLRRWARRRQSKDEP
jgi:hypothetical protein